MHNVQAAFVWSPRKLTRKHAWQLSMPQLISTQNVSDLEGINTNFCTIITSKDKVHYTFCCNILSQLKDNKPFTANVLSDKATVISPDKLTDITFEHRGAPIHMQKLEVQTTLSQSMTIMLSWNKECSRLPFCCTHCIYTCWKNSSCWFWKKGINDTLFSKMECLQYFKLQFGTSWIQCCHRNGLAVVTLLFGHFFPVHYTTWLLFLGIHKEFY